MLLTTRLEDHVKRQEMLVVLGNLLSCMGFLGYHFISNPIQLFIIQVVFAVSEAVGTPVYDAAYSRAVDLEKSAFQWGSWETIWSKVAGKGEESIENRCER